MGDSRPIGVFDSGIGGLTVVKALRDLLPNEKIFYLGDTARVPYGGKSANTVERYSLEMTNMLVDEDVKAIVIACNSASAVALPKLEKTLSVPVVGVIKPGAQAAISATRNRHIGVIGTRATIKSGAYEKALRELDPKIDISARVPIMPICRLRVAATAACAPGLITPTTGTARVFSSFGNATADAELHAITMVFTPSSTSMSVISRL